MKKVLLLLVVLVSIATVACDDEGISPTPAAPIPPNPPNPPAGTDTSKPVIELTEPAANTAYVVIENVVVSLKVQDNEGLKEVRVYLESANSSKELMFSYEPASYPLGDKKIYDGQIIFNRSLFQLPQGAGSVKYKLIVEAEDNSKNASQYSVDFSIHAPDLSKEEFIKIGSRLDMGAYMDWMGYTVPNEPDAAFSFALFLMVDNDHDLKITDTEGEKFAADFAMKEQALAAWDGNRDGWLSDDEFFKGITKLKFYTDWDVNKDAIIDASELAGGIFSRWDHNKDGLLSRAEYEERYLYYFLLE